MFNKCKNGQDYEFEKHIRTWLLVEEPYLLRDLWKIVLEFAQPLMWRPCGEHHNPLLTCLYCAQKMRIPSNLCIRHLIAESDNFLYPFIRHPSRDDAISFSNILIYNQLQNTEFREMFPRTCQRLECGEPVFATFILPNNVV